MRYIVAIFLFAVSLSYLCLADENTKGFPPFYTTVHDGDIEKLDIFWPLYSKYVSSSEENQRFLWMGFQRKLLDSERKRSMFLPFWISGINDDGIRYHALFPFWGTAYDFLIYDYINFCLWPIYTSSVVNNQKSKSVLWPFYSKTEGPDKKSIRFFPFFGKTLTYGLEENKFILWPFYSSVKALGKRGGNGFIFFPFYGEINADHLQTRWYLPPFFRFSKSNNQQKKYLPWPFIQLEKGDINKKYFWPLAGYKKTNQDSNGFLLWPFIKWNYSGNKNKGSQRLYFQPIYRAKYVWNKEEEYREKNWKIWPIAQGTKSNDYSIIKILDLWPFKTSGPIERNWAPTWQFLEIKKSAENSEWSFLNRLIYYNKSEECSVWKFWLWQFEKGN